MSEKETTKVKQERETQMARIEDLPVSQSEQGEVKGGEHKPIGSTVTFTYIVTNP